jgi:broad specificity phosphatase PhoE
MKKKIFLIIILSFIFSCKSDTKKELVINNNTTIYYLIRHAEKDRSTNAKDPVLNELGLKRAENWAKIFKDIPFDKIYSTDYKRTQQTAAPTAKSKGLEVLSYDTENLFNEEFKTQTEKQSVLIVGHSNTTPAFVNAIVGKQEYSQINDSDNGKLFIVTIDDGVSSVIIEDHNE